MNPLIETVLSLAVLTIIFVAAYEESEGNYGKSIPLFVTVWALWLVEYSLGTMPFALLAFLSGLLLGVIVYLVVSFINERIERSKRKGDDFSRSEGDDINGKQ